ncbi:MAG: FCSD flavin-binding domain-containing protein [Burkholderiales bacterium]|nr:FCSD flavin-binding domain-containing protein [Burkholderiales bacterium]
MQRRDFLKALGAGLSVSALGACATSQSMRGPRVVVVGAGYGGATVAKYLSLWSNGTLDITLIEAGSSFVSCPMSNLVLGGSKDMSFITNSYDGLVKRGIKLRYDTAQAVDPVRGTVRISNQVDLPYDRLVLSPGIDFMFDQVQGLSSAEAQSKVLHSWKAGPQTLALRRQLEAMPDGGVYAISIPRMPYRCPPGPYERACQVAWYFKRAKPRSKVLILDGNEDVVSKKGLFMKAWNGDYKGIIEYLPNHVLTGVDAATLTAKFETANDVKANVLNVIPPQRAGAIAAQAGVVTANNRWCEVDFLSYESIKVPKIHVLGDATQGAPAMPKSGHMANQQAKVAAAAILNAFAGKAPNPAPVVNNTCYSMITDLDAVHVASVHQYDPVKKTFLAVPGSGGVSPGPTAIEGDFAFGWAKNIWADTLT